LYSKRAFVHWLVGSGISEDIFNINREELAAYLKDLEPFGYWEGEDDGEGREEE
jgi:hypothetical protein